MKVALATAVLVVLVAVPALAGDGNVPQSTLASLGLGGMQKMSDDDGMQVRGNFTFASSFSMFNIVIPPFGSFPGLNANDTDFDSDSNGSVSVSSSVTFPGLSFSSMDITILISPITVFGSASASD